MTKKASALILMLVVMNILSVESFASTNTPARLIDSSVKANGHTVTVDATFSDKENDYVVDVIVRYKSEKLDFWTPVTLDYVGRNKDKLNFSKKFTQIGPAGDYQYEIFASEKEDLKSERSSSLGGFKQPTFFYQGYLRYCAGANYEQRNPDSKSISPSVKIYYPESSQFEEWTKIMLTAEGSVDESAGGQAFYSWCVSDNAFIIPVNSTEKTPKSVYVIAKNSINDENIRIHLTMGDGLGKIAQDIVYIPIKDGKDDYNDSDPSPIINIKDFKEQYSPYELIRIGEAVTVSDIDQYGQDSSNNVFIKYFYSPVGGSEKSINPTLSHETEADTKVKHQVRIVASDGNSTTEKILEYSIVESCYVSGIVVDQDKNILNARVLLENSGVGSGTYPYNGNDSMIQRYEFFGVPLGENTLQASSNESSINYEIPSLKIQCPRLNFGEKDYSIEANFLARDLKNN